MVVTRSASRSQRGTPATQPQPPPAPPSATTTSSPTAIDADQKARTLAHMNKDHQEDMAAILQHRARLSAPDAADPVMLDLDLTSMTIRSTSGVHTVAIDPPMDTWDDRRARLADLSNEARGALGWDLPAHAPSSSSSSSAATATGAGAGSPPAEISFHWLRGADWVSFAGLALYWSSCVLVYGGLVTPGSASWQVLDLVRFPYGPVGYIWLVRKIFALVVAIHVVEAFWLDRSRLAPGGLRRGSKVWWLWVGAAFFEGLPAYKRWDRLVVGKGSRKSE